MKSFVIWFTGLSSSGKSTLANRTFEYLKKKDLPVQQLNGDILRSIFPKTGFSKEERMKHIKRAGYLASLLEKNNVFVIASFISPYQESRNSVRNMCGRFIEIHVDTSLETCEARDPKSLYKKARAGEIKNFTGIDDPYGIPQNPEMRVDTNNVTEEESFKQIRKSIDSYLK
ncbi:MAG: adenylyl-sulfate kinase [Candidatus Omnitrophica bacterium]|nr:adenylyl-sulfate kinase [Candidatus Omnitrophota bacterium]